MEPMSIIVGALVAGAAGAGKDVASQAVKDAYAGLKGLVVRKFGSKTEVGSALKLLEKKPDAEDRKETLRVELEEAGAAQDGKVLELARFLMEVLKEQGASGSHFETRNQGDGAIAQGSGAQATGKGGVIIDGDVKGHIVTGSGNVVGGGGQDQ